MSWLWRPTRRKRILRLKIKKCCSCLRDFSLQNKTEVQTESTNVFYAGCVSKEKQKNSMRIPNYTLTYVVTFLYKYGYLEKLVSRDYVRHRNSAWCNEQ